MTHTRYVQGMRMWGRQMVGETITVRLTEDNRGQSLSLADEKHGLMLMIPVEPIADLLEVKE